MTNPHSNVSILTLEKQDSLAVLARNHFGRIAYSFRDRVNIEPISYVFENDWIFGRTSIGSKWLTLQHHPWVAFEVEECMTSRAGNVRPEIDGHLHERRTNAAFVNFSVSRVSRVADCYLPAPGRG